MIVAKSAGLHPVVGALRARTAKASPAVWVGVLLATEIVIYVTTYSFHPICTYSNSLTACRVLSLAKVHTFTCISAILLLTLSHPSLSRLLYAHDDSGGWTRRPWLLLQLIGFAIVMLPWRLAFGAAISVQLSLLCWVLGGTLAATSTAFVVASPARWRTALSEVGPLAVVVITVGALTPQIVSLTLDSWNFEPLRRATFFAVVNCLAVLGVHATADVPNYTLSSETFSLSVAPVCSGVEGIGVTIVFLACYFYAFRESLRFPNVWVLLPIGFALSWLLNVVRIATLFVLGASGHPELAVQGFHSHAGWLMFSILALAIIGVSTNAPWFQKNQTPVSDASPLSADWAAARIIPFAAFMGAALLLSTFTLVPDLWYGVKVLTMFFALAAYLPLYRSRFAWQLDVFSIVVGISIGVLWIAFGKTIVPIGTPVDTALAALPSTLLVLWIVLRLVGTIVLVPCVEELFFRGYVLDRFSHNGLVWKLFGLFLSTVLFAMMHERWLLAAFAGALYGSLYLRSGRLTDSIAAHATSNALIGFYALANSQWSLI